MLSDHEFQQLLDYLNRPWVGFRKVRRGVKKRVRRHMTTLECPTIQAYLHRIHQDVSERVCCEQCLGVTISRFFRDHRLWEQLQLHLLPALAKQFPEGLLTWSAGCASGEEPYSLAMIWEMMISTTTDPLPDLRILATDANAPCLARAKNGFYPQSSLKELPHVFRQRWFQKAGGGNQWQIDDQLQNRICWQPHQLLESPIQGGFHLIFLRNNLLTYYQGPQLETAIDQIVASLVDGGLLIIGSHERLPKSGQGLEKDPRCPWAYHVIKP